MRTNNWRSNTPGLRLVGEGESGSASSPYGPMRAGLTTSQATNKEAQLLELLSSLERKVQILEYRYLEVLNILTDVMARLAELTSSPSKINTTEEKDV